MRREDTTGAGHSAPVPETREARNVLRAFLHLGDSGTVVSVQTTVVSQFPG